MPIFEYHCPDCHEDFEELRPLADRNSTTDCPNCRSRRPKRKISLFAASGGKTAASTPSCSPRGGFT